MQIFTVRANVSKMECMNREDQRLEPWPPSGECYLREQSIRIIDRLTIGFLSTQRERSPSLAPNTSSSSQQNALEVLLKELFPELQEHMDKKS